MHEMTLAIQAIRSVVEFAEENGIEKIDTVVLEIGELSLVVPEYMEEAYYAAVPRTMLEGTKLRIDLVPGNGICLDCGQVYNIVANRGPLSQVRLGQEGRPLRRGIQHQGDTRPGGRVEKAGPELIPAPF